MGYLRSVPLKERRQPPSYLLDDPQTEASTVFGGRAPCLEDLFAVGFGGHEAGIRHVEAIVHRPDVDGRLITAVLNRVPVKVLEQLPESTLIDSEVFDVVLTDLILRIGALTVVLVAPVYFGVSYIIGLVQSLVGRRRGSKKK